MKRFLIAATTVFLTILIIGSTTGQDVHLEAFTATDVQSLIIKGLLVAVLLSLLVTVRPRSIEFRTFLGFVSAALTFGTVAMLSLYVVPILDTVLYIEVAIILALEAIENPELLKGRGKKITVEYFPQNEKITL